MSQLCSRLNVMSLLISSFLQSPVPCLPSLLHSPLSFETPSSYQFFLSPLFHLFFESMLRFLTRWSSVSTCGMPQLGLLSPLSPSISLWCGVQFSSSSLLMIVSFSFLLVSYVCNHNHWYCPITLFPELAVLLQTDLCPFRLPVLSFAAFVRILLSIQLQYLFDILCMLCLSASFFSVS